MTDAEAPQRSVEPRTIPEGRRRARDRVRAVQQAAATLPEEGYLARTTQGTVHMQSLEFGKDGEVEWVDVTLAGETEAGDPHYRIYNPPALVCDPLGDIEVRGVMHRRDPLAALAEVVAQYGGAQAQRKGNR
jgi:hypothetical protein